LDRGQGKPPQTIDATNTNVNYAVSDQPMTEEEWVAERVTEHRELSAFARRTGGSAVAIALLVGQPADAIGCTGL
jgi:hypothetical protein